jgi:hypothetical protein
MLTRCGAIPPQTSVSMSLAAIARRTMSEVHI